MKHADHLLVTVSQMFQLLLIVMMIATITLGPIALYKVAVWLIHWCP